MVRSDPHQRAQLILAGAVLLAAIILGLGLLLNSVLFTGATGESSASSTLEETDLVDFDVQLSVRELVVRLNHGERNVSAGELEAAVERSVENYSNALGEARARSGSVVVEVEYDNTSSSIGRRIVQDHDANLTDKDDMTPWTPVPSSADARVGWFTLNADLGNTSADPAIIEAVNDTSDSVTIDINRSRGNVSEIVVTSERFFAANGSTTTTTARCEGRLDRVLLDLYAGTAFTDDCEFTGIGALERPNRIHIDQGDRLTGKYAIVVNRSTGRVPADYENCDTAGGLSPDDAEPCVAPAVWTANVNTTVHGDGLSYENTYNLTIYPDDR